MVKAPRPYNAKQAPQLSTISQAIASIQEQLDSYTHKSDLRADDLDRRKKKTNRERDSLINGRRSDGKGYSIVKAMGLSKKKEFFNHLKRGIRKLANRKLDTSRTITQQKNKLLVEKVIFQAQLEYKIFQKYENAWPVRDLLAQYLRNSSQLEKKATSNLERRIGKRKAEEICGDEESDFWDANEDMSVADFDRLHSETDSPSEASDDDIGEDPSEDGHNSDEDEDNDTAPVKRKSTNLPASEVRSKISKSGACGSSDHHEHPSCPRKKQRKEESEDEHGGESDEDDNLAPVKRKSVAPASPEHTKCSKMSKPSGRLLDNSKLPDIAEKQKAVTAKPGLKAIEYSKLDDSNARATKAHSNSKTAVGRSIKITNASSPPSEDEEKDDTDYHKLTAAADDDDSPIASHQLPKTCPGMDCEDAIPNNISDQLKTALSTYVGLVKERKTNIRLETDICILIKRERCWLEAFNVAEAKGWPATKIEFKDIPSRVLEMYNKLKKLLFDAEARENLWLWTCFEADLEVNHYTIAQFAQMCVPPMSSAIWENSRCGYYGSKGAAIVMHTLLQLFPPTTSTDAFQPLSLLQYLTYFVIPHVVCQFIAQDFGLLSTMPAHSIMVESNDVGELINPKHDDDDELDQIKCATTFALKQRNLEGRTIHDAVKALVALQYAKTTDVPGTSGDQSNARPKPCLVLRPPKEGAPCTSSALGQQETIQVAASTSGACVNTTTSHSQVLGKKARGRRSKKAPRMVEQDPQAGDAAVATQARCTPRSARSKR
ncbi:hypothetical protein BKA82DRAFT_35637 [Pisolithus tinctorius]|nr:hypothetical protein BKA82DRAFT_35637 [Pisolithus tinctorius]